MWTIDDESLNITFGTEEKTHIYTLSYMGIWAASAALRRWANKNRNK